MYKRDGVGNRKNKRKGVSKRTLGAEEESGRRGGWEMEKGGSEGGGKRGEAWEMAGRI